MTETRTDVEAMQRASREIYDDCNVATRSVRPFLRAVALFLEDSAQELHSALGAHAECDEPGAIKTAARIARAYLDGDLS